MKEYRMKTKSALFAVIAAIVIVAAAAIVICSSSDRADAASSEAYVPYHTYKIGLKFDGSGADNDNVTWDFGDGSTGVGFNVEHEYAATGDYIVKVTAHNDKGDATDIRYITILGDPIVSFDTDGGSSVSDITVKYVNGAPSTVSVMPNDPEKAGYTFKGWFVDEKCTLAFGSDSAVSESMTVYAKWVRGVFVSEVPEDAVIVNALKVPGLNSLEYYIPLANYKDYTKDMTVGQSVFSELHADGKKLVFYIYDESDRNVIVWSFDGSTTYNTAYAGQDIDIRVATQYTAFNTEEGAAATNLGAHSGFYMNFESEATLPFDIYVSFYLGDHYSSGTQLQVYSYSSGTKSMTDESIIMQVNSDGYANLDLSECGDYAALSYSIQNSGFDLNSVIIIAIVLVIAIVLLFAVAFYRKRRSEKE
jgi:uncharacterized repeat protein (TIGR02543 family)